MKKKIIKKDKVRQGFWKRNWVLLLCLPAFALFYYAYALMYPVSPFMPRHESYAPYERHVNFSPHFPFFNSYFLMLPENYDPQTYSYPLVMLLHGVSAHMYGGKILRAPLLRQNFPAIVLIPIAPSGFSWADPYDGSSLRPKALPLAMDTLHAVMKNHSVSQNRIYVTGYSMGGIGTYAAVAKYHNVFAAAAPMDAYWSPTRLNEIDRIPIWAFHGARDTQMPVQNSRAVTRSLKMKGYDVFYTEYPQHGHGAWVPAYENMQFWSWLFQQSRGSAL
jgi:predicted peptidase